LERNVPTIPFVFEFALSDKMIIRERSVYDIVTLIAEVSGFADMFMVCAALLLKTLYQPKMLRQAIISHVSSFVDTRKPLKIPNIADRTKSNDKDLLKFVMLEMRKRFEIRFSTFFILVSSIVPARWRSKRTNKVLALADQSLRKIEESLDIKRIIETQDDLQLLL
jgi:hypothetical protein